jgi:hypothetical protein
MNLEPQKFFIGVVDFFSVLMPGALLSYSLRDLRVPLLGPDSLGEAQGWLMFFFSSYLLGHFIFLVGSWLDEDYDKLITWWRSKVSSVSNGDTRSKALFALVFDKKYIGALAWANHIQAAHLAENQEHQAINTYQWAKLLLGFEKPEALAAVQRFEADSKFFRSLFVVLYLLLIMAFFERPITIVCLICTLMGLALWRYAEQRHKATLQAYWAVITLDSLSSKRNASASSPAAAEAGVSPAVTEH